MDEYGPFFNMMLKSRSSLADYVMQLQAEGKISFTPEEAIAPLGISKAAFLKAAARLQKRHMLLNPRQGFYVAVPPQYMSWAAPPPSWYIDALMRHEGRPYYVGLLKAAELHGATHQAVMEFQVITDRQLPKTRAGRSWITFHFRKDMSGVSAGIVERKTDTGSMKISSAELTALDLLRYMPVVGGVDAVATILAELAENLDSAKLADLAPHFERAPVQRLGYLLDHLGHGDKVAALHNVLFEKRMPPWTSLEPEKRGIDHEDATPAERNERWRVRVRRNPDIDE